MEEHYICTGGCRGVSKLPGTCKAVHCPKHGEQLEYCDCEDGQHGGEFENKEDTPDSEEESDNEET